MMFSSFASKTQENQSEEHQGNSETSAECNHTNTTSLSIEAPPETQWQSFFPSPSCFQ